MSRSVSLAVLIVMTISAPALAQGKLGIGQAATAEQVAGWDIDVRGDGEGAPPGQGSVRQGEEIYMNQCAACHGEFGESAGRWPQLAQGKGTLASHDPVKTVGSYFAHAGTVLDYIRRSMPFGNAQSLSNNELYAVTAYVLHLNDIVDENFVLSKNALKRVKMPNAAGFYDDDRETAEKVFWQSNLCMTDCSRPVALTGRARAIDVTPEDEKSLRRGTE
jgi:S-disulfanyl-L-cysteine oxidoreductase SoxD